MTFLTALGCSLAAAPAHAAGAADFSFGLSTPMSHAPSGLTVHILLRDASNPNAKPPALQSVVIQAPPGIRFDSTALPECTASTVQLQVLGADACPSASQLTLGSFSAMSGFGPPIDPIAGDDHVFNGFNEIIEVITVPGTPISPAADHLHVRGSTITADPPTFPGGPPDEKMAIRSIDFQIPVSGSNGKSLITTPPTCPSTGEWRTTGVFAFQDGSSATTISQTPCSPIALGARRWR